MIELSWQLIGTIYDSTRVRTLGKQRSRDHPIDFPAKPLSQGLRSPMATLDTKKPSTGANGQKEEADFFYPCHSP